MKPRTRDLLPWTPEMGHTNVCRSPAIGHDYD